ncbi:unnamed protein product [Caenorhabditis auriculariae]|uniref:Uncharacterized protein n=1 Tax=Caenorhabditis auriculariae TaxID=2777116 RepID=A0A8S1GSP6_9PELO|nr:unnamed protein product [Caenorhabditis auriculariae]
MTTQDKTRATPLDVDDLRLVVERMANRSSVRPGGKASFFRSSIMHSSPSSSSNSTRSRASSCQRSPLANNDSINDQSLSPIENRSSEVILDENIESEPTAECGDDRARIIIQEIVVKNQNGGLKKPTPDDGHHNTRKRGRTVPIELKPRTIEWAGAGEKDASTRRYPKRNRIQPAREWLGEYAQYEELKDGHRVLKGVSRVSIKSKSFAKILGLVK